MREFVVGILADEKVGFVDSVISLNSACNIYCITDNRVFKTILGSNISDKCISGVYPDTYINFRFAFINPAFLDLFNFIC